MALISVQEVSIGFGGQKLLEDVSFQIERGERVGLLGRNGMGKSTLLKMLNDDFMPHTGVIARQQNTRVAYLPQEVPLNLQGRIEDIITSGLIDSDFADDEHHWK
ncbi:MAG TPA: ATP-binding cassette domain-containing protein, partial [Anaerolineales bacterium]|nr:ATP-binding cassette domain-containing protein [Anaerolineales bacterium]